MIYLDNLPNMAEEIRRKGGPHKVFRGDPGVNRLFCKEITKLFKRKSERYFHRLNEQAKRI